MGGPVEARLKSLGLDVEFLAWLEGPSEWLPRTDRIRRITQTDFVAAFQAATWLNQFFAHPEIISPQTQEEWLHRYRFLQHCLFTAMQYSMVGRTAVRAKDLQTLERVLEKLLPAETWREYRADIQRLRKHRQPVTIPKFRARRSGGKQESEQTSRMRAAVEYLSQKSQKPYADLADLWNERLGLLRYHPDKIYSRLRKGLPAQLALQPPAGSQALENWRMIYDGEFGAVFPGPFPLHPKLAARVRPPDASQCS